MTTFLDDGTEGENAGVSDEHEDPRSVRDDRRRFAVTGVSLRQRCVTVALHGDLDATTAGVLFGQLAFFCVGDPWVMVADMSDLTSIDADGVTAIIDARQALRLRSCDLAISGPSAKIRTSLELAGLATLSTDDR